MATLHDFTVGSPGGPVALGDHHGSVVLVVRVGRESGPAPQLNGLERLAATFADQGLLVLGFPDPPVPGAAAPTAETLGVSFPLFSPIDDPGADRLFGWLSAQAPGPFGTTAVPAYTKFLLGRDGGVVRRFAPNDDPAELIAAVRLALAQPVPPAPAPRVDEAAAAAPVLDPEASFEDPGERRAVGALTPDVQSAITELEKPAEESLADIAQDLYEVEAEVHMVTELGEEQRRAAIDAELAAALGEQQAISQADQPGSSVTSDPSVPDGETTPIAPDQRPAPPHRHD